MFSHLLHTAKQLLHKAQPCQLCGIVRADLHSVCLDCWQQLPLHPQTVEKQELSIHVAGQYQYPLCTRQISQNPYPIRVLPS